MSRPELNHYLVLGVERDATLEQIEEAYLTASSVVGDEAVVPEDTPGARSARLEEAYAVLRDPARRAEYDETLD